jgi:hypothetical protein
MHPRLTSLLKRLPDFAGNPAVAEEKKPAATSTPTRAKQTKTLEYAEIVTAAEAASLLRAQTNRTILSLQGYAYQLSEAHVHLLQDEIQLFDERRLLTDPAIIASHDERNQVLTGSFYSHILSGLVPEERGLICQNPDTAIVNLHPSIMRGSWVAQLHAYNRRLLFTP